MERTAMFHILPRPDGGGLAVKLQVCALGAQGLREFHSYLV